MLLSRELREFIECLNSNEVEYLVVGALAVSWHGFPRYSADVDLLIRPSHANAERVLRALSQFGFGSLGIPASDLTLTGKVIQLGRRVALTVQLVYRDRRDYWIHGLVLAPVASAIAEGKGVRAGVHFLADAVDPMAFMAELRRGGVELTENLEQPG